MRDTIRVQGLLNVIRPHGRNDCKRNFKGIAIKAKKFVCILHNLVAIRFWANDTPTAHQFFSAALRFYLHDNRRRFRQRAHMLRARLALNNIMSIDFIEII